MINEYRKFIREYLRLAELKTTYLVVNILSAIFYKGFALLLPLTAAWIIEYLLLNDANATYFYIGMFSLVYVLYNVALYVNYEIYGFSVSYCYNRLQTRILDKLISVDNNFTRSISKGRLMNSVNSDVIDIGDMIDRMVELVTGLLQILAVLVIVALYNIYLAIVFVVFLLVYIVIKNRADRNANIYYQRTVIQDDRYSNLLSQMMSGLQEIKTLNMLDKFINKLNIIQRKFIKQYTIKRHYFMRRDNDTKIIQYIFQFILYVILIYLVAQGYIGISVMVLVIAYNNDITSYVEYMIECTAKIREVSVSVDRVNEILNYDSETVEMGDLDVEDIYGNIEFRNVSLTLEDQKILRGINLKINNDQVVAIVGEAGCGKTMLFNLLLRLNRPTSGTIKIDNIDIFDFSQEAYSRSVSIVNQKPFIFNMSIRRNLDFVDANIKNQIKACKRAGIHDFIETLPNGYNTILRENGSNISGGQKQMISIARTILTDADVLLFDDITTALDPDTAKLVPKLIEDLKKDHTIIMTTKKPELMTVADRIIVMDDGKIVGDGTHEHLMRTNEIYRTLHARKSPSRTTEEFDV